MVAEVSHPQLIVTSVDVDSSRILDEGVGTFENSDRRHVAAGGAIENQDGISHVIGDEQLVAPRIKGNSRRPINLSLRALHDPERSSVPARSSGIDCNGRRQVLAGARDGVAESKRPIRFSTIAFPDSSTSGNSSGANLMHTAMVGNEYEVAFCIQSYSVRVRQQGVFALEKPDGRFFG